jgi:hypothetical protein
VLVGEVITACRREAEALRQADPARLNETN